jgi:hypothetical protein
MWSILTCRNLAYCSLNSGATDIQNHSKFCKKLLCEQSFDGMVSKRQKLLSTQNGFGIFNKFVFSVYIYVCVCVCVCVCACVRVRARARARTHLF